MNVITWDQIIILFPKATFRDRVFVVTNPGSRGSRRGIEKYLGRGFGEISSCDCFDIELTAARSAPMRSGVRRLGDEQSWVIKLSTGGVQVPRNCVDITQTWWTVVWNGSKYRLDMTPTDSWMLLYQHVVNRVVAHFIFNNEYRGPLGRPRALRNAVLCNTAALPLPTRKSFYKRSG